MMTCGGCGFDAQDANAVSPLVGQGIPLLASISVIVSMQFVCNVLNQPPGILDGS
jgi:hypothetical protein